MDHFASRVEGMKVEEHGSLVPRDTYNQVRLDLSLTSNCSSLCEQNARCRGIDPGCKPPVESYSPDLQSGTHLIDSTSPGVAIQFEGRLYPLEPLAATLEKMGCPRHFYRWSSGKRGYRSCQISVASARRET